MTKTLLVVQDVPTQFDVPLYNKIADENPFSLSVIYTQTAGQDVEIGRSPRWDHIDEHRYQHQFLTESERRSTELVVQKIANYGPDHVVVSGYWPKLHRDIMRSLKSARISVGLRSDNTIRHSRLNGLRGWLKRIYLKQLLAKYDFWHPVGQQAADYLELLSGHNKPISFFPYNIDDEWFQEQVRKTRSELQDHRLRLGFPEDSYIVLGIMKWSDREDPLTLVRAFQDFQQSQPNTRLILVGDGPLKNQVMDYCDRLGDLVHTPGYSSYSRLPYWYALADVFVHPAPHEPWGVSVSEALACGVPVIGSTGVGAAIEQVTVGYNGAIFEQQSASSLTHCLLDWQKKSLQIPSQDLEQRCISSLAQWNYAKTINDFQLVLDNV